MRIKLEEHVARIKEKRNYPMHVWNPQGLTFVRLRLICYDNVKIDIGKTEAHCYVYEIEPD
jgi:hypothetical protein